MRTGLYSSFGAPTTTGAMARLHMLMFFLLLVSFAYFHHRAPGWNANSRLALTHAIVEKGTFQIDSYVHRPDLQTGDAAYFNGHYYSDKIIGTSLLGVPAYALLRGMEAAFDITLGVEAKRYWITVIAVAVPGALSGVLLLHWLFLLQRQWRPPSQSVGAWDAGAFLTVSAIYLGTLLFSYGTLFMSYLPATLFLLAALLVWERWRLGGQSRERRAPLFLSGLFAGLAILCEYTYGIVGVLLFFYVAASLRPWWGAWQYVAGGVVGVAPFLLYTWSIFGSLEIPYQHHVNEEFRAGMARGLMGATWPSLHVLALITFHPFRGLFVHSGFLVLALPGIVALARRRQDRPLPWLIGLALAGYLLFNSAYYMWWGGWSFSPRHLAPAIPLLAPAIYYLWRYRPARVALAAFSLPAIALHLLVTATDPQVPDGRIAGLSNPNLFQYGYRSQFVQQVWPAFSAGRTDPNFGTWMGLPGGAPSLLPLLAFWTLIGFLVVHHCRNALPTGAAEQPSP